MHTCIIQDSTPCWINDFLRDSFTRSRRTFILLFTIIASCMFCPFNPANTTGARIGTRWCGDCYRQQSWAIQTELKHTCFSPPRPSLHRRIILSVSPKIAPRQAGCSHLDSYPYAGWNTKLLQRQNKKACHACMSSQQASETIPKCDIQKSKVYAG